MRMMALETSTSTAPSSPVQRSPWHSPVPYLFGGLAAMLGLIAFALLILACSYWKLSSYLENNEGERDLEAGGENDGESKPENKTAPVFEEKFLVIMAGQEKPTFLATPISSRASSFGSTSSRSTKSTENSSASESEVEMRKTKVESGDDQVQIGNTESHETTDQVP